jgi:acetyl esterase
LAVHDIQDTTIDGPDGQIPVRIYRPEGDGPFGTLVYFHGGGWVIGDLDTCDSVCREIATLADLVVVSVDYRLAPEHVFPAAVDDCYAALLWVADNRSLLNNNGKIGVAGESAGGALAAAMAQISRDSAAPELAFQGLFYPVIEPTMDRDSWNRNGSGYMLERPIMDWFWDTYCPNPADRKDPRTAPIYAEDLSGLAPALVVTAEFDPLCDEGQAYGQALESAGNEVATMACDGVVHDFFGTAAVFECSRRPFLATIDHLKNHLNT